ncbi:MAG: DUF368 domain-containing protein [Planctomycetota bacterium]
MAKQDQGHDAPGVTESDQPARPVPKARCAVTGLLLGLANLVPGISGGTMVLIMGLYDEFISSVADATRLKFTTRSVTLLVILVGVAGATVVGLAGPLERLVRQHRLVMYALFIGMTLGGVPLLVGMIRPVRRTSVITTVLGFALMIGIAAVPAEEPEAAEAEKAALDERVADGSVSIEPASVRDVFAGVLGMSAMVLPGISGAYMLVLLGRYEQILAAISMTKDYALSMGESGDPGALRILIPVSIGALLSLVCVTNLLKWFLRHHEKPTVGLLLGIVLGSVVMLWGKLGVDSSGDLAMACFVLIVGFALTVLLSRIGART